MDVKIVKEHMPVENDKGNQRLVISHEGIEIEVRGEAEPDIGRIFEILVGAGLPDAEIKNILGEMLVQQSRPIGSYILLQ